VEPPDPRNPDYDVRADVWSLGISLVNIFSYFSHSSNFFCACGGLCCKKKQEQKRSS